MKRDYLGEFEEVVLLIVAFLDNGYGAWITKEIAKHTGREVRINQVQNTLQRLEQKGMITSKIGKPTQQRGGRGTRIFNITTKGQQTLSNIKTVRLYLWSLIPTS